MIEFGYYTPKNTIKPVLRDEIKFVENEDEEIFISNYELKNTKIVAKEIDFYLKNSEDDILSKAKNVNLLYEARAVAFDYAKDIAKSKAVGKNIIIISDENEESLKEILIKNGFKVVILSHAEIKFLYGEIGEIYINVLSDTDEFEINCDFVFIKNAKPYMLRQSGCYEILGLLNDEILAIANKISPQFNYKNFITYNEKLCQFHERRSEICASCAQVCPSVAILKDSQKKHLIFSDIDCVGCGKCVSVCPTGAIDFSLIPCTGFNEITNLYSDKIILLLDKHSDLNAKISLPLGFLPMMIEKLSFFDFSHFMTLLCKSSHSLVIYTNSPLHEDSVSFINEIFMRKFGKKAIFVARNLNELSQALVKISSFKLITPVKFSEFKRENFANYLKILVANDDLGVIKTPNSIQYAEILVNETNCTLCLSCVGACNTGALIADSSDNTLKFNPSLCVGCGYCVKSCAEKDTIFMKTGEILLNLSFFEYKILARDELFKCIECGKEFATKKSIQKIENMIKPLFNGDELKIKSLYCCADCKAKIMIEQQFKESLK